MGGGCCKGEGSRQSPPGCSKGKGASFLYLLKPLLNMCLRWQRQNPRTPEIMYPAVFTGDRESGEVKVHFLERFS